MSDLKVQINSLKALERLIGGSSDVEMEIRKNVVHAFEDKHLKKIAKDQTDRLLPIVREACTEEVRKTFGEFIKSGYGFNYKIELKPELVQEIQAKAKEAFSEIVQTKITEEVKSYLEHKATDNFLHRALREEVDRRIKSEEVQRTIDNEVRARLSKVFEHLKIPGPT